MVDTAGPVVPEAESSSHEPEVDGTAAWRQLSQGLVGDWEGRLGEHVVTVSYRMTARDSVLLETWMPGTSAETVTAYHLDHGSLMLTHYCGQGNQPRLRLVGVEGTRSSFARFDASDLDDDESALMELVLEDNDGVLSRRETYVRGDQRSVDTIEFVRVAPR